ncbi:MAG TPA: glycosyltransferase, partial [Victivallales bacterium]|nr:glycosyltransferase [Victivallales bacterium]
AKNSLSERFSGEVIVVDNNSTDNTAEIAREFGVNVVFEKVNCIARARNAGAKNAKGKYLVFIDADTVVTPELLKHAILNLDSGKICAGGAYIGFEDGDVDFVAILLAWIWNHIIIRLYPVAAGSFLYCLKRGWEETGGFDESFYASEEIHFSKALKKWGRRNHLYFKIIPLYVKSSSRKFKTYSKFEIFIKIIPLIIFPFLLKRKKLCSFWYERVNN